MLNSSPSTQTHHRLSQDTAEAKSPEEGTVAEPSAVVYASFDKVYDVRPPGFMNSYTYAQLFLNGINYLEASRRNINNNNLSYSQCLDGNPIACSLIKDDDGHAYNVYGHTLGAGSFAKVFVGIDLQTAKPVSVKVVYDMNSKSIKRSFDRECNTLKTLHKLKGKNIVSSKGFIIQDYLYGNNLFEVLFDPNGDSIASATYEKIDLALKILNKLEDIHKQGKLHRDIKLENIIYDNKTGTLEFCDYGFSCSATNPTRPEQGTPMYVAPEQFRGTVSIASEMYSVGVLLFHIFDAHNINQRDRAINQMIDPATQCYLVPSILYSMLPRVNDSDMAESEQTVWRNIRLCLDSNPLARPSLDDLKTALTYGYQLAMMELHKAEKQVRTDVMKGYKLQNMTEVRTNVYAPLLTVKGPLASSDSSVPSTPVHSPAGSPRQDQMLNGQGLHSKRRKLNK